MIHGVLELMQLGILLFVAVAAAGVVSSREPPGQAIAVSFYGLLLAVMFFVYQAPDVALSQLVVGAVALPLMIMITLAKVRRTEERRQRQRAAQEEDE